jgi:excisionase family DNA binding protein
MSDQAQPRGQSSGTVGPRARARSGDPKGAGDRKSSALLTFDAVAQHCAVSVWTVRGWVDAGKLPVLRLPGRLVRVEPEALARFLERCQG